MSAFKRRGAASASGLGTRPGANGQTIVSTGFSDLDRLIGGGLPLGSLCIILEDGWSNHHEVFLQYFLAEGVACGHSIKFCSANQLEDGLHSILPKQVGDEAEKKMEDESKRQDSAQTEEVKLRIAWQYEKYLKKQTVPQHASNIEQQRMYPVLGGRGDTRSNSSSFVSLKDWCHQFDLSKVCSADALRDVPHSVEVIGGSGTNSRIHLAVSAADFVDGLYEEKQENIMEAERKKEIVASKTVVKETLRPVPRKPQNIGRLAVSSLGDHSYGFTARDENRGLEIVRSLIHIQAAVQGRNCAAMITIPGNILDPSTYVRIQHVADVVLVVEALTNMSDIVKLAPDAKSISGILHIKKLPALGTFFRRAPANPLHFIRNKRRKLVLSPVEIDPDAEAEIEEGYSFGKYMNDPIASVVCGGVSKPKKDPLEF